MAHAIPDPPAIPTVAKLSTQTRINVKARHPKCGGGDMLNLAHIPSSRSKHFDVSDRRIGSLNIAQFRTVHHLNEFEAPVLQKHGFPEA